MTHPLTEFEIQTLREAAGEIDARPWGAAIGQALEVLRGNGYLVGNALTPKGVALLRARQTLQKGNTNAR